MKCLPLESTYVRWTVISREAERVTCRCDCGVVRVVDSSRLRSGKSRSCGCLRREESRSRSPVTKTHGMSFATEYRVWAKMKNRCSPQAAGKSRRLYFERGIRVCDRWLESFEAFYADMGPRPTMQHTLDRENGNGNYEPDNCRWATKQEQNRNTRRNHSLTAFGETKLIAEWAEDERCKVGVGTLRTRVRRGYDSEWAISSPALLSSRGFRPPRSDKENAQRNDQRRLVRQAKRA